MPSVTEIRLIFDIAIELWPCFILAVGGVATNFITIMVFTRQGLRESATISLMAIAVIDLAKCTVGFLYRCYGIVGFFDAALAVNWTRVTYLLNSHVQNLGVPILNVIMMYVTFERCFCVCLPLRVKTILTRDVTKITLGVLTIVVTLTLSPVLVGYTITWAYDVQFNRTMAQYTVTEVSRQTPFLYTYLNIIYMFWTVVTFVVIVGCAILIAYRFRRMKIFRLQHSNAYIGIKCKHNAGDSRHGPLKTKLSKKILKDSLSKPVSRSHPSFKLELITKCGTSPKGKAMDSKVYYNWKQDHHHPNPVAVSACALRSDLKIDKTYEQYQQDQHYQHDKQDQSMNDGYLEDKIDLALSSSLNEDCENTSANETCPKVLEENNKMTYGSGSWAGKARTSGMSRRDAQLVKMLLVVVLAYIINIIPRLALSVARAVEPEFNIYRKYHDVYLMTFDLVLLMDFISASIHLFLYLLTSSHFKEQFYLLFRQIYQK